MYYTVGYLPNSSLINRYTASDSTNSLTRTYTYDGLQRVTSVSTQFNDLGTLQESYTYVSDANSTSGLVASYTVGNTTYAYTYDRVGNITQIDENGDVRRLYTYDTMGQLIREYVYPATGSVQQYQYSYDKSGNITQSIYSVGSSNTTYNYTYGNQNWGDLLTNYNGTSISYDAIGNPSKWRNANQLSWQGRNLIALQHTDGSYSAYAYNADGIRTQKGYVNAEGTIGEITAKYTLDGNKIVAEQRGDITLYYLYDDTGSIMGISYGDNTYTFAKNIQGDVIGIYSGGALVAKYEYNAYGQILSITNSAGNDISGNASHIANINPFRYRGYYYDTETGFYYLQSRYYDPVVGRFLNADALVSTGQGILGNNMFAYCNNNPVTMVDNIGYCPANFVGPCPGKDRCAYYELRNTNFDYLLPEGGVIKGFSTTTHHVTTHYSDVTYIPTSAVREYYINEFIKKDSNLGITGKLVVAILDILFGTKFTGAVLLADEFVSELNLMKKNGDDDIIRDAMKHGNGIVVYNSPKLSGDPRIVNVNITFYFEWTGRFGKYPYACSPY